MPSPLFGQPEGGESSRASLAPTPPGPPQRKAGHKGAALRGGTGGAANHAQCSLLREHGEHAEEPPLEAPERRGTREFHILPCLERIPIFMKTGIQTIPLS
jgi:hypothetical protein